MNWAKENKFEAGLLVLAIAAAIGTWFFAGSKTEQYDEAKDRFDMAATQLNNLEGRKPYPNQENLDDRKKSVLAYRGKVEGLQNALTTFRPEEFKKVSPAEFTTKMNEVGESLHSLYDAKNIAYPEKWQMGFEPYTASPPRDEATAHLKFQLDAMEWLFKELAAAGPSELLNVYRAPLPVEKGEPMQKKGDSTPFFEMPVEITFRGRESALREFLSTLADSKEYFFVVRSVRVQNTKADKAPRTSDVKFDNAPVGLPAGGDPFEGFDGLSFPTDPEPATPEDPAAPADGGAGDGADDGGVEPAPVVPAPAPAAEGERILGQVLGAEELHVFLRLDLILFKANVNLPEIK